MKLKKVLALAAAAILTSGTVSAFASDNSNNPPVPEDYFSFKSYCYFKAEVGDDIRLLKDGTVYINQSKQPEDGAEFRLLTYYVDKYKVSSQIVIKYAFDNEGIYPAGNIDTVEEYGQVYKKLDSPMYSVSKKSDKMSYKFDIINHSLQNTQVGNFEVLSENTDDYPLWGMKAHVDKNCDYGRHKFYVVEWIMGWTGSSVVYCYPDKDPETGEFLYPDIYEHNPAQYTEPLYIVVSDRELGDLDNNGKVDMADAELVLSNYSNYANTAGDTSTLNNLLAASDVDNDGEVTAEDAQIIMDYALSGEDISFYEYLENME